MSTTALEKEELDTLVRELHGIAGVTDVAAIDKAADTITALRARVAELEQWQERLTGMKFSDRMHAALLSRAELAESQLHQMTQAEHRLSDAYMRIRKLLNAFDTPTAPTPEQVWAHTEQKLQQVKADAERYQKLRNDSFCYGVIASDTQTPIYFLIGEELDALVVKLQDEAAYDPIKRRAADSIIALRARVATEAAMRAQCSEDSQMHLDRALAAESQLRQVKADAERKSR